MPERGFLIFWIFLLFFSEFSSPGRVWTKIGTNFFFSLFFGLSTPVLAKSNSGKRFFNFLIFFTIFFGIFLLWLGKNRIQDQIFFLSFSAYLNPFWQKIMPERGFLIFWIFLLFFSEFSSPGRVGTKIGTNFVFSLFFGLSTPVLAKSNSGKRFFNFLIFFTFSFGIFLLWLGTNRIQE